MPKLKDTTQTGVSDDENNAADNAENNESGEQKERPKSAREAAMEQMEATRRKQLEGEGVVFDQADDVSSQVAAQTGDDDDTDTDTDTGKNTAEPLSVNADDKSQMVKIKVDGVEQLVPLAEVVGQYQKGNAADTRLREATKLLEEAKAQRESAGTTTEKKQADAAVEAAKTNLDEKKKKFFDSMYEGDQDTARSTFDEIINESVTTALKGRGDATLDDAAVIARVAPAVEQSIAVKSALTQFQKDFKEIARDPYLAQRADAYLNEELAAGKAYDEAFTNAGKRTQGWMREILGLKSEVTVDTTRTEKTVRKQEIDNPASTSAKTVTADAPVEQNVSASIAEMRKGRVTG